VITTSAAPGLFGLLFGRLFGAMTMWIASIANPEQISLSSRLAGYVAHRVLPQWQHLAYEKRPQYQGNVL